MKVIKKRSRSSDNNARSVVNPIHPFAARMAPELALRHLSTKNTKNRSLTVLDPMVGSGTVVRLAKELGHRAIGFDTDPLAVMISETWCTSIDPDELRAKAATILEATSDWNSIPARVAYPKGADEETKKFVRFWFDLRARKQLAALLDEISKVRNRPVRLHLLTAISRTIIVKENGVSLAKDVSHSRPHKAYDSGPIDPRSAFAKTVARLCRQLEQRPSTTRQKAAKVKHGDARCLPLKRNSVDIVITSPPYLNAIDYLRGHKLALVWFGHLLSDLREIRATNIGAEKRAIESTASAKRTVRRLIGRQKLDTKKRSMFTRYVDDVDSCIREVSRVLRPSGKCVVVVGDSNVGGVYVRNSLAVKSAARKAGLRAVEQYRRPIPRSKRYLPPPSSKLSGKSLRMRMRSEVVLVFQKAA